FGSVGKLDCVATASLISILFSLSQVAKVSASNNASPLLSTKFCTKSTKLFKLFKFSLFHIGVKCFNLKFILLPPPLLFVIIFKVKRNIFKIYCYFKIILSYG